jgi:hypothetical protein
LNYWRALGAGDGLSYLSRCEKSDLSPACSLLSSYRGVYYSFCAYFLHCCCWTMKKMTKTRRRKTKTSFDYCFSIGSYCVPCWNHPRVVFSHHSRRVGP